MIFNLVKPMFSTALVPLALLNCSTQPTETTVQQIIDRASTVSGRRFECSAQTGRIRVFARYADSQAVQAVDKLTEVLGLEKDDSRGVVRVTDPFDNLRGRDTDSEDQAFRRRYLPQLLKDYASLPLDVSVNEETNRRHLRIAVDVLTKEIYKDKSLSDREKQFWTLSLPASPILVGIAKALTPDDVKRLLDGRWLVLSTARIPGVPQLPGRAETYQVPSSPGKSKYPLYVTLNYKLATGDLSYNEWNLNRVATNATATSASLIGGYAFQLLNQGYNPYIKWERERASKWSTPPPINRAIVNSAVASILRPLTSEELADEVGRQCNLSVLAVPSRLKRDAGSYFDAGRASVSDGWCLARPCWPFLDDNYQRLIARRPADPPQPTADSLSVLDNYCKGLVSLEGLTYDQLRFDPYYFTVGYPREFGFWQFWNVLDTAQKRALLGQGIMVADLEVDQRALFRSLLFETLARAFKWDSDPRVFLDSSYSSHITLKLKSEISLYNVRMRNGSFTGGWSSSNFKQFLESLVQNIAPSEHADIAVLYDNRLRFECKGQVLEDSSDIELRPWLFRGPRSEAEIAIKKFVATL